MNTVDELLQLLDLEEIDQNLYRGQNYQAPWGRIFGGQVLGQALHAAYETVPDNRIAHSLHGYFILTGDVSKPVLYDMETLRDGGSFTTRRVTAKQHGKAIFNMAASFKTPREGFVHQIEMPDVPSPEELKSDLELVEVLKESNPELYKAFSTERPIEFRPVEQMNYLSQVKKEPFRRVWLKAKGRLPDDLRSHQEVLAYASDYNLLGTSLLPHRDVAQFGTYFLASLDHAMWFHRPFRVDEWLLYVLDSPSASNSLGFNRGSIFNKGGALVASVTQEGLMAPIRKKG